MDFIAKEKIVLALGSPLSIGVRVASWAIALSFAGAGLMAKFTGISPDMSRIYSGVATFDYLQDNSLGNQLVENLIENVFTQAITEIGKSAVGRSLQEVETTEKTQATIVAQS
jgi:hypothetical protein